MAFDPEKKPKEFLIIVLAVGMKIFSNKQWSNTEYFSDAENFVKEVEQRYGKLNP